MASTTYTVKKGDTLSHIAVNNNTTVSKLLELNPDITNKDLIYVGQIIVISGDAATKTVNKSQRATITAFGLQSNTDRTVFATWEWSKSNTDHYEVKWMYGTGDGIGFVGEKNSVNNKQDTYNAPENATHVAFYVRPISKSYKSGEKEVKYWSADWSTVKKYYFSENPPSKPPVPTISIDGYKLTAKLENLDINATGIRFKIEKNGSSISKTKAINITNGAVTYSITVEAGSEYRVSCQGVRDDREGEWSDWSSSYISSPAASEGIYLLYTLSSSSVGINWYDVSGVHGYEIQYTEVKRYFDSNPTGVKSQTIGSKEDPIVTGHAEITGLTSGNEYFFRVRSIKDSKYSDWTEIKSIVVGTQPSSPTTWSSSTTVNSGDPLTLYWVHNSADGSRQTEAELELTINGVTTTQNLFETVTCSSSNNTEIKIVNISNFTLTTGTIIRVLMLFSNTFESPSLNVNGIGAITIKAKDGENCYWDANSVITFKYDGTYWNITENNQQETNNSYSINTLDYAEGTVIQWRVRTAGIMRYINEDGSSGDHIYGPWSIQRTVNIYAPPSLLLSVTNNSGESFDELKNFPINILVTELSQNQKPIGYHLTITANESYETVDNIGNKLLVNNGGEVYHKYFDTSSNPLSIVISAGDVNLENNIKYTITCEVTMDSGLTGEAIHELVVAWSDEEYWPNAEIGYDKETFSTIVRPYCENENGTLIEGVKLSLYRREFDGSFTELAIGLDNLSRTYITDPHPSLDFARYRVVATSNNTGAISYYDLPGYPIGEKAIIIQWDEEWVNFDATNENELQERSWSGSLLKLPYNIDISDNHDIDTELIEYIGRKYPVSYYGTQLGHTSTWSVSIPKEDKETLYSIRRLASWAGNVYVREPSGSGYWASISISYSQEHCVVTVPVSFDVKRIEGGI